MTDKPQMTPPPRVTAAMIEAAVVAEFKCYYPDRHINEFAWAGTPRMVIAKMIEAALREAASAETAVATPQSAYMADKLNTTPKVYDIADDPLFGVPSCAFFKSELCVTGCEYGIAGDCPRRMADDRDDE